MWLNQKKLFSLQCWATVVKKEHVVAAPTHRRGVTPLSRPKKYNGAKGQGIYHASVWFLVSDIACIGDPNVKFLLFHQNNRPAYYGTFTKCSEIVTGSEPLAQDTEMFEYEVDSDEEWEEPEEGEELGGSDNEEDKDPELGEEDEEAIIWMAYGVCIQSCLAG